MHAGRNDPQRTSAQFLPDHPTEDQGEHDEGQEDEENDLGDIRGTLRDAGEPEETRDDRDNGENDYPAQHGVVVFEHAGTMGVPPAVDPQK